jgi:glycosyltransferase involved in cell wall biosynthesis
MDMNLPRVLILNQPFNQNTGGGITISNLFKGWPKENLAVLCSSAFINCNTNAEICETYYQLGYEEYVLKFPFNLFKRKYNSGIFKITNENLQDVSPNRSSFRTTFINDYLYPILKWVGIQNSITKIRLSQQLKNWLDEYKPDIIYAQAQRRETLLFCTAIQEHLKKPMVFHMMDDWTELEGKGLLGQYWYPKVDREFKEMLSKSSLHLSISDAMAIEYKRRYGYDFQTFHNPIELDFWKKGKENNQELAERPTILYAGRMGLGIEESVKMMARVVTQLNKELNSSIRFVLQVSEKPEWTDNFPCVEHRGFVAYEDLPAKFAEADILYLPYDFSSNSLTFIKYSMPTKASEYMISGTPILIFAPAETAIVDYAKRYQWAEVVTENDIETLKASLKNLILDKGLREKLTQTAIQIAECRHDAIKVRMDFKRALASVSEKTFPLDLKIKS